MKKFLVKYIVKTTSRCGAYLYKGTKEVEAENETLAREFVKTNAPGWYGFKRCQTTIKSIVEV